MAMGQDMLAVGHDEHRLQLELGFHGECIRLGKLGDCTTRSRCEVTPLVTFDMTVNDDVSDGTEVADDGM